ncbi:Clp protease N-terminal domain-containing protein [Micromonospora chokoriensis]|uniref:Clp protease N-terminal domain-containing protein n=1 Tax=Micromonospora chokoriensis TaxID=356851 RepID=UPI000B286997|nr:Clp protease N-terminal domain-containing protein [Micromonospora chokoriensis]
MIILSYLVRWLPLPLLAAACLQNLGWWRAGVVVLVYASVPRHWIVGLLVTAASLMWLEIPYRYLLWAAACRLGWDLGFKAVFARWARARKRRITLPPAAPRLRCGHGLAERIEAADRLAGIGLADGATDGYLAIIADHPAESSCDRTLLLRTAEAARSAGDCTLAAELGAAVLRGVPRDPTGRLAVIAVRAHATRAAAYAELGDLDQAARSLRQAQRLTQANRATERYVRWTAAQIRLAGRRIRTPDELTRELADALSEQQLTLREALERHRLTLSAAWRLLAAGDGEGAERAFFSVRHELELDAAEFRRSDGAVRVPPQHQYAWRLFTLAVAGEVAAVLARDEELSAEDSAAADLATNLAWYLDENLTGARMLLIRAQFEHRHGRDAKAAERLQRARRFADLGLHTFTDHRRQVEWLRLRRQIAATSQSISGSTEPPISSPWPVTATEREQAAGAHARAEALFDRLAAKDPETFRAARHRLVPGLDIEPDVELHDAAPAARTGPPVAVAADPPAPPKPMPEVEAVEPPPADPPWMASLMAAAGGRCWTLLLALDKARELGHGHVGAEHLVLAVTRDGDCAEILAGVGLAAEDLWTLVGSWYHRSETTSQALDPALAVLVRDAASIAIRLGATRVRATHLLMAVVANPCGAGAAVMRAGGADLEEVRVRADAAFAGPVLQDRTGPLFTAGEIVHQHRLTLPAWLAIGHALDLAQAGPGRVLDVEHLAAGADAYQGKVLLSPVPGSRGTVRVSRAARATLADARRRADAAGEWGVDLEHLCRAVGGEEPAADPARGPGTRAACERAARRGERFVTPEDVREASSLDRHGLLLPPVPVLTPAARRARDVERSTP